MSTFRGSLRLAQTFKSAFKGAPRRLLSTNSGSAGRKYLRPLALGAAVGTGIFGIYQSTKNYKLEDVAANLPIAKVSAASAESQPSVWSQTKDHALFLWINLKPEANSKEVMKAMTKLQKYVDEVSDPKLRDENDEIWAGVGFGPNFYKQVGGKTRQNYTYAHRKGNLGDMPSSGGDVFVHAKSNEISKLFELCQVILRNLPAGSVDKSEDVYSFVYRNGRDLSGFIDGTENAADDESRQEIAVEKETGGSYVITQKWIHDLKYIDTEKDKNLESFVGRSRADSIEISRKSITSHVARMTSGNNYQAKKPFQIVRQSMPFGTVSNEAGLFFIGYAASPENHDYMLDRMVGAGGDGHCDDIMRLSKNVKGTYWYFPGAAELKKFA